MLKLRLEAFQVRKIDKISLSPKNRVINRTLTSVFKFFVGDEMFITLICVLLMQASQASPLTRNKCIAMCDDVINSGNPYFQIYEWLLNT